MAELTEKKKPSSHGVSRREALAGGGAAAALFLLGGAVKATAKEVPAVRPPGSLEEGDFLSRCLRCDRCRSACHASVISTARLADGLISLRTPVMNFHHGWCDFCGKCADACPTGAIQKFDANETKIGLAHITQSCIALRTGACRVCVEACAYDAITLNDSKAPVVDPDICNGCGQCELDCPAQVYQASRSGHMRGIEVRPRNWKEESEE